MAGVDVSRGGADAGGGRDAREADFADQLRRSFRQLWTIAVGVVGDSSAAEDVVQDAAVIALGKLEQYEPGTNFTAWMGRMVRYTALNHARKVRRRPAVSVDPAILESTAADASDVGASRRNVMVESTGRIDERVRAALQDVGEMARACLLLRTLDGLSYAEISVLLDVPQGTAMSHVHRTRRLLRERLRSLEAESD